MCIRSATDYYNVVVCLKFTDLFLKLLQIFGLLVIYYVRCAAASHPHIAKDVSNQVFLRFVKNNG